MGVLYYVRRDADESRELFALNKVYRYAPRLIDLFRESVPLDDVAESAAAFATKCMDGEVAAKNPDWASRIFVRLKAWAAGARIAVISEDVLDEYLTEFPDEEYEAKITGSAHDKDYEVDGTTYKPGSAW